MKPSVVKGTRDFGPVVVQQRQYIFDTLRNIFQNYGFQPIETPSMELRNTLEGKYGDEGSQLYYKILNNGDFLSEKKLRTDALSARDSKKTLQHISKKGLRYDLTVPFARYVVMNRNDITLPFKRYQIQPVWRGDRPQFGRYCEFYQCDVDVVGSDSLLYEAELTQIYDQAFKALDIKVNIRLSNRKILEGLAHYCGYPQLFAEITTIIDKLDKIGWERVQQELNEKGIELDATNKVKAVLDSTTLDELKVLFEGIEVGEKGIEELETVLNFLEGYPFHNNLILDFSLARGLSYYTGCIFEVVVDTSAKGQEDVKMGSIGGGGRYANLTEAFGWKGVSGVGVSFGADRIYDVLNVLGRFPESSVQATDVMILCMGKQELQYGFRAAQFLREAGIRTDLYPTAAKFKKQIAYANKKAVPYTIIIGGNEMESGELTFKNMQTGEQKSLTIELILKEFLTK